MPNKNVMILDTSVLCVWLKVPGKETCGSGVSCLDFTKVDGEIQTAIQTQYTLVLPLASIIETGNQSKPEIILPKPPSGDMSAPPPWRI